MSWTRDLGLRLDALKRENRLRSLRLPAGIDFASNDYLGFSSHPALALAAKEAVDRLGTVGAGGSRLLRGNHPEHEALEQDAAAFFRTESALYFNSGFDANLALFSALPTRHGAVIVDERVHASVKEGARASFAKKFSARHNDPESFDQEIQSARRLGAKDVFIAVESLYSMDGDVAPLADLLALARRHDAVLIVDEAHATGVFGPSGRGLTEGMMDECLITLHTCGKALGASGALVACSAVVRDYLVNTARPFLFSTAPSPILAAVVRRALRLIDEEPQLRAALHRNIGLTASLLKEGRVSTQIVPIVLGDEAPALQAAAELQRRGFDVRAIRPPTVPEGTSRLRISVNARRTEAEIRALFAALTSTLNTGEKEKTIRGVTHAA